MTPETLNQKERLVAQEWNLRLKLEKEIYKRGGWVNTHAHLDRAYTINSDNLHYAYRPLQDKWSLVDEIKSQSSVEDIYDRMAYALEDQLRQGVTALGTFIDVDEIIEDKAIRAAARLRENNPGVDLVFINQTLKGVFGDAYSWFLEGAQFVDIIGGLPGKDKGREDQHLDVVLGTAKALGKKAHVHVDQFNSADEMETELLLKKTAEHSLFGQVVAIHGISLAAHPLEYRKKIYEMMAAADVALITCPTAWIDSRRNETLSVTHNSIAPVEELVTAGIMVGLGTDNIADVYKPFTDGNLWMELRFLLESCHYYEIDNLADIATVNGRKILGLV